MSNERQRGAQVPEGIQRQHPSEAPHAAITETLVPLDGDSENAQDAETMPPTDPDALTNAETVAPALLRSSAERATDVDERSERPSQQNAIRGGEAVHCFGDYELLKEIARGGMGVVYKARQTSLNRVVALKMILAGQLASEEDVRRFRTEAEAAANLEHPGIVPVYEVGEHNGQHYFSMGYVEGESLADRIARGPVEPQTAAELVRRIAAAIGYAHGQGVVHRDLKPANVLLARGPKKQASRIAPKITDFGLAKQTQGDSGLTGTGQILGTPSYMPPEQAAGDTKAVGPLSDVYSLGAILYCLLTGRPPFQSANVMDTLMQVLEQDPVPPRDLNNDVPRDLETICLKCLEKDPDRRYQTAEEFANDLDRYLKHEPITARPVSRVERIWRWSQRRPASAAWAGLFALTLVFGFSAVVWQWRQAESARGIAADNFADAREQQQRAEKAAAESRTQRDLAEQRLLESEEKQRLLEASRAELKVALDASEKNLAEAKRQRTRADENVAIADASKADADEQRKTAESLRAAEYLDTGLKLAGAGNIRPGMLWIARSLTASPEDPGHEHLARSYLASYQNKLPKRTGVINPSEDVSAAAIAFDGDVVAAGRPDGRVAVWSLAEQRELMDPLVLKSDVTAVTISSDGKLIFAATDDGEARIWNREMGKPLKRRFQHPDAVLSARFNADGSLLATGCADRRLRVWDVRKGFVVAGPSEHRGAVTAVDFSPDGRFIASTSSGVFSAISTWDAISGRRLGKPVVSNKPLRSVRFSPDGRFIAVGGDDQSARLWNVAAGRFEPRICKHDGPVVALAFSSNGRLLLTGAEDQSVRLWNIPDLSPVGVPMTHGEVVRAVGFAGDSNAIVTASADGEIRAWTEAAPPTLTPLQYKAGVLAVALSEDGKTLLTGANDKTARL